MESLLGFAVIVVLYAVIGLLAAVGSMNISQKIFRPRAEQIFYALLLIMIAGFYLAFAAYFRAETAWRVETSAVAAFVVISLLGLRFPLALIVGYPLHGMWDLVHELHAHGAFSVVEAGQFTAIPLAYGVFCSVLDFCMGAYFYTRRSAWSLQA